MRFFYSPKFLRSFTKSTRSIQNEFRLREVIFRKDLFDPRLKTHKLKGKNEWSFLITYKIRVIFIFENENILFVNIGDHSIYRK
jgi:mRNA-degrading endonuclease YafQ of YafQ-DinJ toxin-antitoxin module